MCPTSIVKAEMDSTAISEDVIFGAVEGKEEEALSKVMPQQEDIELMGEAITSLSFGEFLSTSSDIIPLSEWLEQFRSWEIDASPLTLAAEIGDLQKVIMKSIWKILSTNYFEEKLIRIYSIAQLNNQLVDIIDRNVGVYELKYAMNLLTNRVDELNQEIYELREKQRLLHTVPMNTLGDDKWELASPPLMITVEKIGRDDFVSCFYDADIYGYGDSIPSAIEDLALSIINQYEYLLECEVKNLGTMPKKQLMILNRVLKRID